MWAEIANVKVLKITKHKYVIHTALSYYKLLFKSIKSINSYAQFVSALKGYPALQRLVKQINS